MCLLLVAHDCCPGYRLVVAANRDEFHDRPTAAAAPWEDHPQIIGGRDLEAGGSWLALDRRGRFATITNVRAGIPAGGARSRGLIVNDFLDGEAGARDYAAQLARDAAAYAGFNVLLHDGAELCWYSNAADHGPRGLARGIYTLSNALLDTAWPKTERLRAGFGSVVGATDREEMIGHLLELLRDEARPPDGALPDTGIGHAMERVLSSIFIAGSGYGTRCSTVVLIDEQGSLTFHERRYDARARVSGDTRLAFELPAAPA
ncbi:MAG: NRDE family protein [Gammaproteobacteria bacterium]